MIITPAEGTSFLLLDEQPAVFSAAAQKIYALNKTAALIWCGLEQGEASSTVAHRLVACGVSPADATTYVNRASRRWLRIGLLQVDIKSFDDLAITSSFSVSLGRSTWTIQVTNERIAHLLLQLFDNHNPPRESGSKLKIVEAEGLVYVFDNGKCVLTCVMDDLVPSIKAYLTQLLVTQCAPDIVFHAACLEHNAKALLISGVPGGGKTTLALDLLQHGFEYCSDDIVLVRQDGTVTGVPFAPTIKSGAWRLLKRSYPSLNNMPVHRRPDGKRVRYLSAVAIAKNGNGYPVGRILFLNRRSEGAAKLVPLRRLDGLKRVIKGSFSSHGHMTQAALISCKSMLARADLFELSYANVTEASAAIMAVYGKP